jgi:cytochrome c5
MKGVLACVFVGCAYCGVQTRAQNVQAQALGAQSKSRPRTSQTASSSLSEGEIRFEAHCGRCHLPPEDLSPREAKAVIRQMRVRAMLSAEDERLILRYIAP